MRRSRLAVLVTTALAAAGCSDFGPVEPVGGAGSFAAAPATNTTTAPESQGTPPNIDLEFAELNDRIPGFGGMYFDGQGNLVAWLAPGGSAEQARPLLEPVLAARRPMLRSGRESAETVEQAPVASSGTLVFAKAEFSWRELYRWSGSVRGLLADGGVVFTDIDETRNRLLVAVADDAAAARVSAQLAGLGVPAGAVLVEKAEPMEFAATVRDSTKTSVGGMQILANGGKVCTDGFNTAGQGKMFITASHCTNVPGGTEGTTFYSLRVDPGAIWLQLGVESADPAYWAGWLCPPGRLCRWSDAAQVFMNIWVHSWVSKIHRTTYSGWLAGSITINPLNPTFTIVADNPWPYAGEVLEKVGRTTGWTWGPVTNTCINVNVAFSNRTFLCQARVLSGSGVGDSGAPVFRWSGGSSVELYGLLSTRSSFNYTFSPVTSVLFELGPQSTH